MPDDLSQALLDRPTAQPAPETSEPAPGMRTPGSRLRDRGRLSGLAGWLLVAIASLGMFVSTSPMGGPDEPEQNVTAWYVSGHGLRPGSIEWFSVPASFATDPCFAHKPDVSASCMPSRVTGEAMASTSWVLPYAPPYYLVVGVGQRLAVSLVGAGYADIGGRLASFILNLGALLLLSFYMRRRHPRWGNFLLLVSTPTSVFMGVVVNPSGWEITCGIVMAAVLSEAVWGRQSLESDTWPRGTTLILAAASAALCLTRPLGLVWASGLTVSAVALVPSIDRRLLLRVSCAVAPGIALGILWALISPSSPPVLPGAAISNPPAALFAVWFALSLLLFPLRLQQMYGILGWLDTPAPLLLVAAYIVAWGALLIRLAPIRRSAAMCGVFGIVILPSLIETIGWAADPLWWQGRYTLPFALGFGLLLLLRSGQLIPRTISFVSGISLLSLGLMVLVNAVRYDFGLNAFDLPASLAQQGISPIWLLSSALIGVILVIASGYLLVQAWRMERDTRPRLGSETPLAPAPISIP